MTGDVKLKDLSRWLLQLTRPVLGALGWSLLMRIVALIAGALLLGVAVHGLLQVGQGDASLGALLWSLIAIALVKATARYLEQYAGHYVAFRSLALIRVRLFDRLEPQAPAAVEGRRTGDLLSRATRDVDRVEVFFAHTLAPAITAVIVPLAATIWLSIAIDPRAGAIAAIAWVAMVAVSFVGARASTHAAATLRHERGLLAQQVTDSIQGVREVVTFGAQHRRLDELDEAGRRIGAAQAVRGRWAGLRRAVVATLTLSTPLLVLAVVGNATGDWSLGAVAAAVVIGVSPAAIAVEEFSADLDQAFAAAVRLREIIDAPPVTAQTRQPVEPPRGRLEVRLEQVSFTYPSVDGSAPRQALDTTSVTMPADATTALVGVSGAGKSTIGAMIARFYDPDQGHVLIGGVDVRDLADDDLRGLVSYVHQRPYIFHGTVRDNLLLAQPDATEEDLLEACRAAAFDSALAQLPDGLDTIVGEHGERLSGGQRQRLAIARALLRDTPVLVLDEVTSELDTQTQGELAEAIRTASASRTTVVIAHRLETVRDADLIVVVDAGTVVEQGTHQQLLAAGGAYARLWERQPSTAPMDADFTNF